MFLHAEVNPAFVRAVARAVALLGLVSLPLGAALQAHIGSYPPPMAVVARSGLALAAIALALSLLLRTIARSIDSAVVGASVSLGFLALYPSLARTNSLTTPDRWFAVAYVAAAGLVAALAARIPPVHAGRAVNVIAVSAAVMLIDTGVRVAPAYRTAPPAARSASPLLAEPRSAVELPDMYHIVLDGFGRPDVVRARYGADLTGFVRALRDRGFVVEGDAVANYVQTYLSIASVLNADYLTALADTMGDSHSRKPAHELIQDSRVFADFKRLGYQIVVLGSPYSATATHRQADICHCGFPLVGEFEATLIAQTPVRDLPLGDLLYRTHRNSVNETLATLQALGPARQPRLVFAHVFSPHPPFVLGEDGGRVTPDRAYVMWDGSMFPGSQKEYVDGYRQQVRFTASQVVAVVDRILASSRRPAVIAIHGDHGPRYRFDATDAARTDAGESVPILLALRWAPGGGPPERVVSPVNIYRAFLRRYAGAGLPLLDDASFVSSFLTPYRFRRVDPSALRGAGPSVAEEN